MTNKDKQTETFRALTNEKKQMYGKFCTIRAQKIKHLN